MTLSPTRFESGRGKGIRYIYTVIKNGNGIKVTRFKPALIAILKDLLFSLSHLSINKFTYQTVIRT